MTTFTSPAGRLIYVAGSSAERSTRAKPVIAALRAAGHWITHDWTTSVDLHCGLTGHVAGEGVKTSDLRDGAELDLLAIRRADDVLILMPQPDVVGNGVYVELGYAIAWRHASAILPDYKPRILVSGKHRHCVFAQHRTDWDFATDAEAVEYFGGKL